jgi:phosphate transport system ATP-binding protein
VTAGSAKVDIRDLTVRYSGPAVVEHLNLAIPENSIYAIIGPSGSGKTSVLRTLNLLSVDVDRARVDGAIVIDGQDVLRAGVDRAALRRRIGMVFATPQPLPGSIYDNLVYGPRLGGIRGRAALDELVESSLRTAELWDEVKDRLRRSASALSGGQQQRLCIARTIAPRGDPAR